MESRERAWKTIQQGREALFVEMQRKLANNARMFSYFDLKNVGAGLTLELPWAGVSARNPLTPPRSRCAKRSPARSAHP
jgi:hypothetical protein